MSKILILLSTFLSMSFSHDIAIAIFKIYEENNIEKLEIRMNALDLSEALKLDVSKLDKENITIYLENNLSFKFDENIIDYKIEILEFEGDHIIINTTLSCVPEKYESIAIDNSCLINIKGHSNIMQIELRNEVNDYRMHVERQRIHVNF